MAQVVSRAVSCVSFRVPPNEIRALILSTLRIPTAKVFEPLLQPARYKGVYGGRGSGKSQLRADLQHLRRWRRSVEQAQNFTFKAAITIIVSGLAGALWLGVKGMLGK